MQAEDPAVSGGACGESWSGAVEVAGNGRCGAGHCCAV